MDYDYILAGSGLSGLSLLYCLLTDNKLKKKNILVLDNSETIQNDKTFCFWEEGVGMFEPIVYKKWENLQFIGKDKTLGFKLSKYCYKMIRSSDFHEYVIALASKFNNVSFKYETITQISCQSNGALVKTETSEYLSQYVFNSTRLFDPKMNEDNTLLQHFKGWFIQTESPIFNKDLATLMDFRLSQENGTSFMYVLPTSPTEALVEYTLFSKKVLSDEKYDLELSNYISEKLGISDYKVKNTEFGVIPMTTRKFIRHIGNRVINIGTAGGNTKASTGYTFQFVQKNTHKIIDRLKQEKSPAQGSPYLQRVFDWYDRTLLDVLLHDRMTGEQIFTKLFERNSPEKILEFLANDSNFMDRFKIRNSVPMKPFIISGIKSLV